MDAIERTLAPKPEKHTLRVNQPPAYFGDLAEDLLTLGIEEEDTFKVVEEEIREEIILGEVWTLPKSIFAPRQRESDARDFYDTPAVMKKQLNMDWQRAIKQDRFSQFVSRESKRLKVEGEKETDAIRECIEMYYHSCFMPGFTYYGAMGTGGEFSMQLNEFTALIDEAGIPDPASDKCKRSDCDTLFITANVEDDKNSIEGKNNDDNSLTRFEFVEVLVRLAVAKYGYCSDPLKPSDAMRKLITDHLEVALPPEAKMQANKFRQERLYFEEVDAVLKGDQALLKALYSRYRLPPSSGGRRHKVLLVSDFIQMMLDMNLIDDEFTLREAKLCFLQSQMAVVDDMKDPIRNECVTFTDFLEVLGHVADLQSFPTAEEIQAMGCTDILDYTFRLRTLEGEYVPPRRPSSEMMGIKTRPLAWKIGVLLELMWRMLMYNPDKPTAGQEFSKSDLLKKLKKKDADLGP
ncbi:hypothetical protein CYMTET_52626 [Cymbomonas tetramitiformis]|uniref:Uncharacterized protein n=1 Tax=Cymbomonas tetramitiformis TaxID=36881 RepID=A0AAE0BIN8_9CHLO|nr:hypothetical protein CYMTET_52626 [Cymbomonas tetramitiformis]